VKVKAADVADLPVCWQNHPRWVVFMFGWLALKSEGDATRLSVSVTPSVVFWLSSLN
jgi:hypothetical protein